MNFLRARRIIAHVVTLRMIRLFSGKIALIVKKKMPKDKIGQEIKQGSIIVYGHTLGRCAGLRIGIVKEIKKSPDARWKEDAWRFKVRGIEDDWNYENPENFSDKNLCSKDGTLMFVTRIIVLKDEQIPEHYRKILREHYEGIIS